MSVTNPVLQQLLQDFEKLLQHIAPDAIMQVAPAFEDFPKLPGSPSDPSDLVNAQLDNFASGINPSVEVISVAAGDALPDNATIQDLINKKRRQSIAVYARRNPALEAQRQAEVHDLDLQIYNHLIEALTGVPFIIRIPYSGLAAIGTAFFAKTNSLVSLSFQPCSCGPIIIDQISASQERLILSGGGGFGRPDPNSGTPASGVVTTATCSFDGFDLSAAFNVSLDEELSLGSDGAFGTLNVKLIPGFQMVRVKSSGIPELEKALAKDNFGQKLLAAIVRPLVSLIGHIELNNVSPNDLFGPFTTLAGFLATPQLIAFNPATSSSPLKLIFDVKEVKVQAGFTDVRGFADVIPRQATAHIIGQVLPSGSGLTVIRARAITNDFRFPSFAWSTNAPGAAIAPTVGPSVTITYPAGSPLQVSLEITDDAHIKNNAAFPSKVISGVFHHTTFNFVEVT